ncbi:conserved hypothetical protein [Ricinus communis]|uniref:Uncharacterized protein n=1 Tax=Ricinus communis TaxID=3988 RepID=B9SN48_RICCO|nr:conserved hypothetical protein [Ricinus communis]
MWMANDERRVISGDKDRRAMGDERLFCDGGFGPGAGLGEDSFKLNAEDSGGCRLGNGGGCVSTVDV